MPSARAMTASFGPSLSTRWEKVYPETVRRWATALGFFERRNKHFPFVLWFRFLSRAKSRHFHHGIAYRIPANQQEVALLHHGTPGKFWILCHAPSRNTNKEGEGTKKKIEMRVRTTASSYVPYAFFKQAEGEIYSFEIDASELTGAGATSTEVRKKMPSDLFRAVR